MRKHLPLPPSGWEISGKADGGKRTIRCTKCDRHGNQCLREIRFASIPPPHRCIFQPKHHEPAQTQLQIDRFTSSQKDQRFQIEVAHLIAITDSPLDIVERPLFKRVLHSLIEIGRTDPNFDIDSEGCRLTRARTRGMMVEYSRKIHDDYMTRYAQMPCVSLAVDAGTIERRHFLDIMILAPYSKIKPFLYDAVENLSLTAEDYGTVVTTAIKELHQRGVNVRSIVGDNLPAQVAALAHWSSRSYLKQAEESYLHGIKYSPCMCHFIQLVVGDLFTRINLSSHETMLQTMIAVVNYPEVLRITKSRCHPLVQTRWLSRYETLTWLLSWQEPLCHIDPYRIPKPRRSQFRKTITRDNFAILAIFHKIIFPFIQAIKLFEKDEITLCHVYPTLKALKTYFQEEVRTNQDSNPAHAECCGNALSCIKQRQYKLLDKDLVKAAFWLTSFGYQSLSDNTIFVPTMYQLNLRYRDPAKRYPIQGLPIKSEENSDDSSSSSEEEHDEADNLDIEEAMNVDELEEVPVSHSRRNNLLPFLTQFLTSLILEDVDPDISDNMSSDVHHQVEESLQFFFCNPDCIAKCRSNSGSTAMEVELWNWLKFMIPDRTSDRVTAKVISIVSIPASEASCERSFSRQKRIMGRLRTNSKGELLRARYLFGALNL
jgi:hypothetical protein